MVRNVHARIVHAPVEQVGPLLDRLGGPDDVLWPTPGWHPMLLDGPVAVGAAGGHGAIRYRVTGHEPGRTVEFEFTPGPGIHGWHTFSVEPAGPDRTALRHVAEARFSGVMRLAWPLAVRWAHDAVLEELLDNAERAVGAEPVRPARRSAWVRVLRAMWTPRSRPTEPQHTPLLDGALPRVDAMDAQAVAALPGMPLDPQVWADALFRDPPRWVLAALGLRELLVGLVGIDRGGPGAFDTLARTDNEVLLGADSNHLDFRASVRREPDRVVLTTVVQLHNLRGRLYWALVRPVHPIVVRAMFTRAARRLSGVTPRKPVDRSA
ncbi:uncharacterized protein DUF2867 [Pseudonocardia hierapolitana]|uniref:Uncharacterized protein DUF2867 n=1 Tax=Pseudonocardia hierapolitana TaxID=1128676 RepID=A0A561SPG0_9PSEU|nr:DUF2867 domain-containing protein [Pseudonocardia hierapolitana]TWF76744.1 uncharacterized protein DUF2867 [Pseudonocardia hierapolitana]